MSAREKIKEYGHSILFLRDRLSSKLEEYIDESDLRWLDGSNFSSYLPKATTRYIGINKEGEIYQTDSNMFDAIKKEQEVINILGFENNDIVQSDIQKLQSSLMRRDGGEFKLYEVVNNELFGRINNGNKLVPNDWCKKNGGWQYLKSVKDHPFDLIPRKTVYCIDIFQSKGGDKLSNHPYPKSKPSERRNFTGCEIIKTLEFEL